ncbi:hypothetical protein H8356DRAFT_1420245 [Neocallimastix lanati (nom. inval.)]|nr:hypothetical protein H8356DRAFT_1420245 [Neocallimastix sp. JGI-2020a]
METQRTQRIENSFSYSYFQFLLDIKPKRIFNNVSQEIGFICPEYKPDEFDILIKNDRNMVE